MVAKHEPSFTFSFERALEAEKDLDTALSHQEARVDKIVNKVRLGDHAIIGMLLTISHDPDELRHVAKALERVADILPTLDELRAQKSMLDLAKRDPDKFKWMFGSFEGELDTFLTNVYEKDKDV